MIKITNPFLRWGISAVLALLILFGTYHSIFSLAAFLGCCLMIFFCDRESILLQMFFIMPMANIFKMTPGAQSFFTILLLAYVLLHLVLPRKATTLIILFGLYVVLGELIVGSFNLFRTIKLICNVLFLSSILNSNVKIRHKEIFLSFITGNFVASVFKLLDSDFFRIGSYIETDTIGNPNLGNFVVRFSGLYSDPNYYAVGMVISLCLIVILYHRKELHAMIAVLFSAVIVYFLIQTYSKSAILMVVLPLLMLLYSLTKNKKYILSLVLTMAAAGVVILAIWGKIPALSIVVERFLSADKAESIDVNKLTTGRLDLWLKYAEHLIKNINIGLFGVGISSGPLGSHGAHNTYLDIFYYLGCVGGVLLMLSLIAISQQSRHSFFKRSFLNYSVLICIVIMYFFLSELFYFDLPFHIFLALAVLNLHTKDNIKERI